MLQFPLWIAAAAWGNEELAARLEKGGVVELPPGTYELPRPLVFTAPHKLTLRGAGRQKTIIKHPGITIRSTTNHMYSWLVMEGLTFQGDSTGTCVAVEWGTRLRFVDVEFREWKTAVDGKQVWDSHFEGCSFSKCGDEQSPAVALGMLDESKRISNSNNVVFLNCQFEPNYGISLLLEKNTTKCRIIGSKFHGDLPEPARADHLKLDGAYSNVITGCNFTNGGGAAIRLSGAKGNIITANQIAKCEVGVAFEDSIKNIVTSNAFAVIDLPNKKNLSMDGKNLTIDTRRIPSASLIKLDGRTVRNDSELRSNVIDSNQF